MVQEPTAGETLTGSREGSRFGRYRLRRLLGRGGFGEVYEAQDTEMDRVVALKLMAAPYSQNEAFRQRLDREARTAGRLHEPHVVPIHHCGEIDGQLYIDMRLIEGTDLLSMLASEGRLDPARAVAIVRQIAAALDAAHAQQVIHRDVKPANILLTGDDFACLVDFGLANAATDAKLTSSGTTIGTFAYMAPERLGNAEVSHHTDIYALACVLYECLTGSPPYDAVDLPALITAHLNAPIPQPSQQRAEIPAGFDDVIARGMAKDPQDRYASAGEFASAAHQALSPPEQEHADTIVASTQAAALPDTDAAATVVAPASSKAAAPTKKRKKTEPAPEAKDADDAEDYDDYADDDEDDEDDEYERVFSGYGIGSTFLAVLSVAAVVLGVFIWHAHREDTNERAYLSRVMQKAAEWTGVLINMNTGNLDSSLQKLHDGTVGELNTDFEASLQPYRQVVQKLQSHSVGQIESVAIETVHRDLDTQPGRARPVVTTKLPAFASRGDSVMVVATSVSENAGSKPLTVHWSLRLEVSNVEGKLMISRLESIR